MGRILRTPRNACSSHNVSTFILRDVALGDFPVLNEGCFVGLDLSLTSTGFAAVDFDSATFWITAIQSKRTDVERLVEIRDAVLSRIGHPVRIAIEGYAFGARMSRSHALGELGGALKTALADRGLSDRVLVVPPTVLKKAITGKGIATKPEVVLSLFKRFGLSVAQEDKADAAVLALIAAWVGGRLPRWGTGEDALRELLCERRKRKRGAVPESIEAAA